MKTLIFAVLFLNLSTLNLFSQNKNDYNWIYGFETLDLNGNSRGVQLNFNDAPVNVDSLIIPLKIYLSNATISDNNGDLLFYTNGCAIANKNHEIMLNSEGLNPGQISNSNCEYGYSGGNQSCLILPISESGTQYYLFHQASTYDPNLIVYTNKL